MDTENAKTNAANRKPVIFKMLRALILIVMGVQILYGIRWMAVNISYIPIFGDTGDYVWLSTQLKVDEYRTIIYPLLVRGATFLGKMTSLEYQTYLYILQILLSFASLFYAADTFAAREQKGDWKRLLLVGWIALYLMTIPMITFMNLSVLTDSLATSFLVFGLAAAVRIVRRKNPRPGDYIVLTVFMLLEYATRADRLYSGTLCLILVFAVYFIKRKESRRRAVILMTAAALLISTLGAKTINQMTQHPGLYGRTKTNLDFVLLDRIVWPNMTTCYSFFPDEIKEVISPEEAAVFDDHNNNVMYQLAPLVVERVGQEKANEYFRTMTKIVFHYQTRKVLFDIAEDIVCVCMTPVSAFLSFRGYVNTADKWNLHCVSGNSKELSYRYYKFYQNSFMILLLLAILYALFCRKKKGQELILIWKNLSPMVLMCVIIALWFSIGDGAPPNDRYALLHYLTWTWAVLGTLGIWKGETFSE